MKVTAAMPLVIKSMVSARSTDYARQTKPRAQADDPTDQVDPNGSDGRRRQNNDDD